MEKYNKIPEIIGKYQNVEKEMMYYQYLPIKMTGFVFTSIEKRLEQFEDLIESIISDYIKRYGYDKYRQSYMYLTVKRQYIKPGVVFNRPGWHSDGFGTDDINYIWSDCCGTVFNNSEFMLSTDHVASMSEMIEQAKKENDYVFPDGSILFVDQYSIHRVQEPDNTMLRTFLKISFSKNIYDLEGNSHNYEINYNWEMRKRQKNRNIPQKQ